MPDTIVTSLEPVAVAWRTAAILPAPLFAPAGVAWRTEPFTAGATAPDVEPAAELACMIVLGRIEDFNLDGSGDPETWKPLANNLFGTAAATRELGWGTVLSEELSLRAPTGSDTDDIGLLLAGTVGDETEILTVHCDVALFDPAKKPRTSDIFTRDGKTYCIFSVEFHSEHDEDTEMTVAGIRWNGLTKVSTPDGINLPDTLRWT